MNEKIKNGDERMIEELLKKFYSGTIEPDELRMLYAYFLQATPVAGRFQEHVPVVRPLAMMYTRLATGRTANAEPKKARHWHSHTWARIAATGWAAAAVLLLLLLPKTNADAPLPMLEQTYMAEATIPKAVADYIAKAGHTAEEYAAAASTVPKPITSHTETDLEPNAEPAHDGEEMMCMAGHEAAETTPLERYNNHEDWEIYCNNGCSSEDLNEILADVLYASKQNNDNEYNI